MQEKFKTVLDIGMAEISEKKSRFIAHVAPVKTEEEAKKFIDQIKKKYYDAAHNVFAYQIGNKNQLQRFSDDGEPQGTAGMPVLNVLSGEDIKNCCIVVTRYFGGTLLGTGGLVRAYGKCAKDGLLSTGIAEITIFREVSVSCDYPLQGKVQYHTLQGKHIIKDTYFTQQVEFIILVEEPLAEMYMAEITDITSGKATITSLRTIEGAFVNGEFREL